MAREKQTELLGSLLAHFGRRLKQKFEDDPGVQELIDSVLTEERADVIQRIARLGKDEKVRMFERLALHIATGRANDDSTMRATLFYELERAEGKQP